MKQRLIIITLLLFTLAITATAQSDPVQPPVRDSDNAAIFSRGNYSPNDPRTRDTMCRSYYSLDKNTKKLLSPSAEDNAAYKNFLKQKNTGLIRLLPGDKDSVNRPVRFGGSVYSFACRDYTAQAEILFTEDKFSSGDGYTHFSLISNIGDVPIEDVTKETVGVKYLANFVLPLTLSESQTKQKSTFESDGFKYERSVTASVNNTYILRSVIYGKSDSLIVFRVVGQDADGIVTILWKRLERHSAPRLKKK